jgi:hypothetical protein
VTIVVLPISPSQDTHLTVKTIDEISLDTWVEQFDFRAQMDAEAIGGDLANQLATLLLRTIFELTQQSPNAMFADASIKYSNQMHTVAKGITNDPESTNGGRCSLRGDLRHGGRRVSAYLPRRGDKDMLAEFQGMVHVEGRDAREVVKP